MKEVDPHLPINKIAALVVAKSNDKGFDFKCGSKISSMTPLPMRQFPGPRKHDLTGTKFGDFTVIGCATFKPASHLKGGENTVRWVSKCKCGRYQMFTTKAVKNNRRDYRIACVECEKLRQIGKKDWIVIDKINGHTVK